MKMDAKFTEDVAEWEKLNDKQEGPQDGALGYTGLNSNRGWLRGEPFQLDEMGAVSEVRVEPKKGGLSDACGGESIEEDGVRDCIKGCTQTEEDEDRDETRVSCHEEVVCDPYEGCFRAMAWT